MSLFFEQILAYFIGFEKNPKSELSSLRLTTYYVRETQNLPGVIIWLYEVDWVLLDASA